MSDFQARWQVLLGGKVHMRNLTYGAADQMAEMLVLANPNGGGVRFELMEPPAPVDTSHYAPIALPEFSEPRRIAPGTEREFLRTMIDARAIAGAELEKARVATGRSSAHLALCTIELDAAKESDAAEMQTEASSLASRFRSGEPAPLAPSFGSKRGVLIEAEAKCAAAQIAHDSLTEELAEVQAKMMRAAKDLTDAANMVIRAHLSDLVEQLDATLAEASKIRAVIESSGPAGFQHDLRTLDVMTDKRPVDMDHVGQLANFRTALMRDAEAQLKDQPMTVPQ